MIYRRISSSLATFVTLLTTLLVFSSLVTPIAPVALPSLAAPQTTTKQQQSSQHEILAATTAILPFGFETNTGRINNTTVQQRAETLGASWVRLNTVSWRNLQLAEDDPVDAWNWDSLATFEAEVTNAVALGLTPMVIIDHYPEWTVIPYTSPYTGKPTYAPCGPIKTDYFAAYALFASEIVKRYSVAPYNVKYWELGNEVDIDAVLIPDDMQHLFGCWGNANDDYYGGGHYGEMLKVVAPAIKAADPDAHILIGGLLLDRANTQIPGRGQPEKFLEGILRADAADSFDIVAFHSYPWYNKDKKRLLDVDLTDYRWASWGGMTVGKANYLRSVMKQYDVDKPLFLNEAALLIYGGVATTDFLQTQADHLVRVITRAMAHDVRQFSWYTLHSSGWNSSGLLETDGSIRPAYTAYRYLIQQAGTDTTPTIINTYGTAIEAYRFTHSDNVIDVLWSKDETTDTVYLDKSVFVQATTRDGAHITPTSSDTRVALPVWVEPVYIEQTMAVNGGEESTPTIENITPTSGYNDVPVSLTITGTHFDDTATVYLEQMSSSKVVSYVLQNTHVIQESSLHADVPASLPPGTYDVVVQNGTADVAGRVAVRTNGYTVTAYQPRIDDVRPAIGMVNKDNNIHIYGTYFSDAMRVRIGNTTLPTDSLQFVSSQQVRVTIPANAVASGTHDMVIVKPDTTSATHTDAITMVAANAIDLTGVSYQLWTNPIIPRAGYPTQVGVVVQQYGVVSDTRNVNVRYYRDESLTDDMLLGTTTIALTDTSGMITTSPLTWTTNITGTMKLCAVIDTTNSIAEAVENNNTVCRDVWVVAATTDSTPPHIEQFVINNETHATTSNPQVNITLTVDDMVSPTLTAAPDDVIWLTMQEYQYHDAIGQWVPLRRETYQWYTTTTTLAIDWQLLPFATQTALHAWAADASGNVSFPVTAYVTYAPTGSTIEPSQGSPSERTMPLLPYPDDVLAVPHTYTLFLPLVQHGGQ